MHFFQYVALTSGEDADAAVGRAITDEDRAVVIFLFAPEGTLATRLSKPSVVEPIKASVDLARSATVLATLTPEAYRGLSRATRERLLPELDRELMPRLSDEPIVVFHPGRFSVSIICGFPELTERDFTRFLLRLLSSIESGDGEAGLEKVRKAFALREIVSRSTVVSKALARELVRAATG